MSTIRTYYRITGGKVMDAVKAWLAKWDEQWAKRRALAEEVGSTRYLFNDYSILAFHFDDPSKVPAKWEEYPDAQLKMYRPNRRSKASRQMRDRMIIPLPTMMDFGGQFTKDLVFSPSSGGPHGYGCLEFIAFEKIGSVYVLSVPHQDGQVSWQPPEGCEELKTSELLALQAAAKMAKEAAAAKDQVEERMLAE